ncbi:MAG: hypothetical protein RLZZ600_678 [Actinomycetota bacterium]|jgi:hypothetical protein
MNIGTAGHGLIKPKTQIAWKALALTSIVLISASSLTGCARVSTASSTTAVESGPSEAPAEEKAPTETVSQSNARRSAESYLNSQAFSRKGLIEQLEYEGFNKKDATYGADAVGADWKEQAALSAKNYLESQAFSRQGLIDQLIYEGFSKAEATYGVDQTGL